MWALPICVRREAESPEAWHRAGEVVWVYARAGYAVEAGAATGDWAVAYLASTMAESAQGCTGVGHSRGGSYLQACGRGLCRSIRLLMLEDGALLTPEQRLWPGALKGAYHVARGRVELGLP